MSKYETVEVPHVMVGNRRGYTETTIIGMGLEAWIERFNLEYDVQRGVYLEQEHPSNKSEDGK